MLDVSKRVPTVRHFWSYCRLVPGAADSGGRHRHRPSKDGNRYLKLAFSHATVRAIQYFPEVRQWYLRWKRKKLQRTARALVAKELAQSVYVVLHDEVEFHQCLIGKPVGHAEVRIGDAEDILRSARRNARGVEPPMVFDCHLLRVPDDPHRPAPR